MAVCACGNNYTLTFTENPRYDALCNECRGWDHEEHTTGVDLMKQNLREYNKELLGDEYE